MKGLLGARGVFIFLTTVGRGGVVGGRRGGADGDVWEVFCTNVEEKEFLVAFFFVTDGTLCSVTANVLIVIGGQAQEAGPSGHGTFEVGTRFSLCLKHCTTISTFVGDGGQ